MKPTFIVTGVAALFLTAVGANAQSPTLSGTYLGGGISSAPLPAETNPGAIGGAPQSLEPASGGGLGLSDTTPMQTYGAATGTAGSSIFSPNASGSSTSGMSNGG
jgi:hypothetical protein